MAQTTPRQEAAFVLARELLQASPATAGALAWAITRLDDPALQRGALQALETTDHPEISEAIWPVWQATRHPDLDRLLEGKAIPASAPLSLSVLSAMRLGQSEWIQQAGPDIVAPLMEACQDRDPHLAQRAQTTISSLQNSAAREEVCRLVLDQDYPAARRACLEGDYAPRDPYRRALFYLLTEQWEKYQTTDFDRSLLRAVYQAGDAAQRQRIGELARRAGWADYVEVVTGQRSQHSLERLTPAEWEVILTLLNRSQRQAEIWRLAQFAPALRSAQLLSGLLAAGWKPEAEEEAQAFAGLAAKAADCLALGAPLEHLLRDERRFSGHSRDVTCLAFGPAGEKTEGGETPPLLASGSADRTVRLWQADSGQVQAILEGHTSFVVALSFGPVSSVTPGRETLPLLASGAGDRTARLWRVPDGQPAHTLGGHAGEVNTLAFSPDGRILASGAGNLVRAWDCRSGRLLYQTPPLDADVRELAFSPDGQTLGGNDERNTLYLWEAGSGDLLRSFLEPAQRWSFLPPAADAQARIVTAAPFRQARIWEVASGAELCVLQGTIDGRHLAASPDGRWLAASDRIPAGTTSGSAIRLWELPGNTEGQILQGSAAPLSGLAFSPDGRLLAAASQDRRLRIWQTSNGRLVTEITGFEAIPQHLTFWPAGGPATRAYTPGRPMGRPLLACAEGRWVRVWRFEELGNLFHSGPQRISDDRLAQTLDGLPIEGDHQVERAWLDFVQSLLLWHRRYEIELGPPVDHIQIGDFDIELEG